jgi:PIN domain nuclease of toxin-antitoxin system
MTVLLDTHAFLWAALEPGRLSVAARTSVTDPANEVMVSSISFWEISLKFALGKLQLNGVLPEDLPDGARQMGFAVTLLSEHEAASFHRLPRDLHRDPFDRMLAWQAICHGWTLLSRDSSLQVYQKHGLRQLW